MKKALPYILVAVLAMAVLGVRRCGWSRSAVQDNDSHGPAQHVDRDHGFDRRVSYLEYTRHAKCRMECRQITQAEVEDIMQHGQINYRKSDVQDRPCPTYALDGYTQQDNQHVRIVFAQCDHKTKVVTCIDLDHDFECHCPGDDK